MAFGDPINLRLSAAAEAEYTAEAARRTIPLRTLLRDRLEAGAVTLAELRELRDELMALRQLRAEFSELRQAVEALPASTGHEGAQPPSDPLLVALQLESLLLLRALAGREKVASAQAEMRRRGLEPLA